MYQILCGHVNYALGKTRNASIKKTKKTLYNLFWIHVNINLLKILKSYCQQQGWIQDFKLGGGALKKIAPSGGRPKFFGVFRVKNHDFTPTNLIFSNCGGRCENFWGILCEKSRFYAKKSYLFQFQGGHVPGGPPSPGSAPAPASDMSTSGLLLQ